MTKSKFEKRYTGVGWDWYLETDEGSSWVSHMVKDHIERLESENAELRSELESVGIASYLYGRSDLKAENAKLRELILHMYTCMGNVDADGNHECFSCEYEDTECDFAGRMAQLGIGVGE